MAFNAEPATRDERLWANFLPVIEVPLALYKFELEQKVILSKLAERWAFFNPTKSRIVWAFGPPGDELSLPLHRITALSWKDFAEVNGLRTEGSRPCHLA